jgi:hypothetical protein
VASRSQTDSGVESALVRLNAHMLGGVLAVLFGGGLCLATWVLLWQGGAYTGQMLGLLGHLLPGYEVSPSGAIAGGVGAGALGYAIGLGVGLSYGPWLLRGGGASTSASEGQAAGPGGVLLSLRPLPLALVSAALLAVALVLVTTWLWWRYGGHASPHLDLLVYYLPGYSSDPLGALVGAVTLAGYGFVVAFSVAWLYGVVARLRAR